MPNPSEPSFSDPRLTAYLLDELDPVERAAFERELSGDPSLRAALAELRGVSSALAGAFAAEAPPVLPRRAEQAPRPRRDPPRDLSPEARAVRIARWKEKAPKLGRKSTRRRYRVDGFVAALVATVALVGIFSLQQASRVEPPRERDNYVALAQTDGPVARVPLEQRIAAEIEAQKASEAAAYDAVAEEIARALEASEQLAPVDGLRREREPRSLAPASSRPTRAPEVALEDVLGADSDWLASEEAPSEAGSGPENGNALATLESASPLQEQASRAAPYVSPSIEVGRISGSAAADANSWGDAPAIVSRGFHHPGRAPAAAFDLSVDSASYGAVRRALQDDRWPAATEVRIEELINHFGYAEAAPQRTDPPFDVEMEVGQAPWEPVHYLVRVTLKAIDAEQLAAAGGPSVFVAREVRANVRFNPTQVAAYRMLGYDYRPADAAHDGDAPARPMESGAEVTALYEIVPVGAPSTPGLIDSQAYEEAPVAAYSFDEPSSEMLWMEVRYRGTEAERARRVDFILHVPANIPAWRETSRSFRWAAAVASFGMELKDDPWRGRLDWDLIEALARSTIDSEPPAERREFLDLIGEARRLDASRG